jgi:two-component system response regulator HydG
MKETVTVLVVDDDHRMVKTICDILKVKGFEAEPAYSGEEALEKIQSEKPDCVLMDIRMPGISGVEAMEMIRSLAPDLPVILMSAYPTDEQMLEAKRYGAYSVLTKPVDLQLVLSFLSLLRKEESILIVDDDEVFCSTLKDILQARGYRVETEIDPGMVMDHMERNYKLAVILDLKLGNTDGLNILKDIRARYPSKPVVLVTDYGKDMAVSIEKGFGIGAYTCLYKPFETNSLLGIVEEISRKKLRSFLGETLTAAVR